MTLVAGTCIMCTFNYTDHIFTTILIKVCLNSQIKDTSIMLQKEKDHIDCMQKYKYNTPFLIVLQTSSTVEKKCLVCLPWLKPYITLNYPVKTVIMACETLEGSFRKWEL